MPNDAEEQDRLDLHHHIYRLALNGALHRAPLGSNFRRALDFGTGTGIWAIDMADEYPEAEVVGVDLSPIQPGEFVCVPCDLSVLCCGVVLLSAESRHIRFYHGKIVGE